VLLRLLLLLPSPFYSPRLVVSSSYSCLTLPSDIPIRLVDVRVCLLSGFRRLPASFLTVSAGYDYD
jgi:hypothetical protein